MSFAEHDGATVVIPANMQGFNLILDRMSAKRQINPIPRASGVYQIRCIPSGKIYIGSALNLRNRWSQHRRSLHRSIHKNIRLQEAWKKYGEASFEFSILEFSTGIDLLLAEQAWIDKTGCLNRRIGFNICPIAGSPGGTNIQTWEGFVDPDGNKRTIVNLHEFCRVHRLDFPSMHRLAKGKSKLKSYKGWTHRNSIRQRDYVKTYEGFIDPLGRSVKPIQNLAAFCRKRGLDNTHMVAVLHGRICSHRGWTHMNSRQRRDHKTHTGFIDPKGKRIVITNLEAFCRAHNLHPVRMHTLKNGSRKTYKGWTWRPNDERFDWHLK